MQDVLAPSYPTRQELNTFLDANGLRRVSALGSTAKLMSIFVAWLGLYALGRAADDTFVWLAAWTLMAFLFEAMGAAVHEAAHEKLYRARIANHVAGWVVGAPRLYNFATYQISHLEHHRHTHDRERDPEPLFENTGLVDYFLYLIGSGTVYSLILFWQGVLASFGRGPSYYAHPQHRRRARIGTVIVLVELGVVVAGFRYLDTETVHLWLVPFLLCNIVSSIVTKAEHYECAYAPATIYESTRTIHSNRLFGFLLWNNNLHAAHHLVPTAPGHALPRLQRHIDRHCAHMSTSYLRWHAGLVRSLARKKASASMLRPRFWISYNRRLDRPD